jgi:hypothetical protein
VTEYARERDQGGVDEEASGASERLGFFAHEMRNLINTATAAHEVLKTGNVGVSGNTSAVLQRSLAAARALISRSLAEVRLTEGHQNPEQFPVAAPIEEVASAASLESTVRGGTFIVTPIERNPVILGDRQVLAAVLSNLLQNAFKFTRPASARLRCGGPCGMGRPAVDHRLVTYQGKTPSHRCTRYQAGILASSGAALQIRLSHLTIRGAPMIRWWRPRVAGARTRFRARTWLLFVTVRRLTSRRAFWDRRSVFEPRDRIRVT